MSVNHMKIGQTNEPDLPNTELREAACLVVVKWISELPDETTELVNIKQDEWQKLYTELASLFQAREQQLLTELLGELLEKHGVRYGAGKVKDISSRENNLYIEETTPTEQAFNDCLTQVVSVIERYREGL